MNDFEKLTNSFDDSDIVCIEESSELIKAITKNKRKPSDETRANLLEEMADVLICMELLKLKHNISDEELNTEIKRKMQRNIKRITEGTIK